MKDYIDYSKLKPICCPYCYRTIIRTGPRGERGPAGPSSGEQIEVRSTTTIDAGNDARVESTHLENVAYLDFYIPRGDVGVAETLLAGNVESVDSGDLAEVNDRYEGDVHFLDFKIPKGEVGPMGPRGLPGEIGISEVITIDGTETVDFFEPAEVQDDFDRNIHHLTFYIPKGTPGAPNINASVYNPHSQTINNSRPLVLDEILINNGMTIQDDYIKVPYDGTYMISYSINNSTNATSGDVVGVTVNSNIIQASKRPLVSNANSSATLVVKLKAEDEVSLNAILAGDRTISSNDVPSANLTIVLLAL